MSTSTRSADPWPVTVVGVTDEDDPRLNSDPRGGLSALAGEITLQFLRTSRGVTLGSTLTRRPELVAQIRGIEGIGAVRTSPIGGTVGPGGEHWLSFLAVARLPDPCPRPLDRLTSALRTFIQDQLSSSRVRLQQGRVEGAWCPGFSDMAVDGRKLAGLGLRLTAGWGLVRGVIAVSPPDREELQCLDACHLVFGPGVDPSHLTSLAELPGLAGTDRSAALRLLGG
ncbi:MAG: hypothetical protein WCB86_01050 [Candidatus Dormiibacterota bacterium]